MRSQIDIEDYYEAIEEQRSIYGDGIFELLDITHAGNIGFGEFIQSIVVMCLFEYEEIMKYCFYVFDKDKNGYVEKAELDTILNVFHHVASGEKLGGNPAKAKKSLKIADDGKVRVWGGREGPGGGFGFSFEYGGLGVGVEAACDHNKVFPYKDLTPLTQ